MSNSVALGVIVPAAGCLIQPFPHLLTPSCSSSLANADGGRLFVTDITIPI